MWWQVWRDSGGDEDVSYVPTAPTKQATCAQFPTGGGERSKMSKSAIVWLIERYQGASLIPAPVSRILWRLLKV